MNIQNKEKSKPVLHRRQRILENVKQVRVRDLDGLFDDRCRSFPAAKLDWCRIHRNAPKGASFFIPQTHWFQESNNSHHPEILRPQVQILSKQQQRWDEKEHATSGSALDFSNGFHTDHQKHEDGKEMEMHRYGSIKTTENEIAEVCIDVQAKPHSAHVFSKAPASIRALKRGFCECCSAAFSGCTLEQHCSTDRKHLAFLADSANFTAFNNIVQRLRQGRASSEPYTTNKTSTILDNSLVLTKSLCKEMSESKSSSTCTTFKLVSKPTPRHSREGERVNKDLDDGAVASTNGNFKYPLKEQTRGSGIVSIPPPLSNDKTTRKKPTYVERPCKLISNRNRISKSFAHAPLSQALRSSQRVILKSPRTSSGSDFVKLAGSKCKPAESIKASTGTTSSGNTTTEDFGISFSSSLIGQRVYKQTCGKSESRSIGQVKCISRVMCTGTSSYYTVIFEDGDEEEMSSEEIHENALHSKSIGPGKLIFEKSQLENSNGSNDQDLKSTLSSLEIVSLRKSAAFQIHGRVNKDPNESDYHATQRYSETDFPSSPPRLSQKRRQTPARNAKACRADEYIARKMAADEELDQLSVEKSARTAFRKKRSADCLQQVRTITLGHDESGRITKRRR